MLSFPHIDLPTTLTPELLASAGLVESDPADPRRYWSARLDGWYTEAEGRALVLRAQQRAWVESRMPAPSSLKVRRSSVVQTFPSISANPCPTCGGSGHRPAPMVTGVLMAPIVMDGAHV